MYGGRRRDGATIQARIVALVLGLAYFQVGVFVKCYCRLPNRTYLTNTCLYSADRCCGVATTIQRQGWWVGSHACVQPST